MFLDSAYPLIAAECEAAMTLVMPASQASCRPHPRWNMLNLVSYATHWPMPATDWESPGDRTVPGTSPSPAATPWRSSTAMSGRSADEVLDCRGGMRIHHLNCGTMCPNGARLVNGEGGFLEPSRIVCHCLLIEGDSGLVLVDTGFGVEDTLKPRRLGAAFALMRPRAEIGETALTQIEALGFAAEDVKQIVATHLDPDHSGGLPDFPLAEVHVFARELDAAMSPTLRDRPRYRRAHWSHNPHWIRHEIEGDEWFGFEGVKILPDLGTEVLMVPLIGHTLGHTGIAIKRKDGWLLHCGDAYFHHDELSTPPGCPSGLRLFQNLNNADRRQRLANQERLRELVSRHGEEVSLLCSHDPYELDGAQASAADAAMA